MPEATAPTPTGAAAPSAPVQPAPDESSVSFTLDGRPVTARKGEVIISAAERAGTYIPRFCYHPRMEPVGMCRMCLVEVSGPRGATLQPACFISVAEGMEVVTESAKVKKAQDGVLEMLLVNHPLDCPVCDKGGECPLQDQTLAYGPGETRFVEEKRHFEKPIAISELVLLDRERCIQCARCTRFADEIAGDALIDFAGRGERVEVATFPDEPFSSYFSGNTVQICPVGALTATPYRFSARPWDLDQVESTCTTCSMGCRVAVQSSSNRLTRLVGLDADPVNQSWLCDKGRFVFESVNGDEVGIGPVAGPAVAHEGGHDVDVVPATASQIESLKPVRGQFLGEVAEEPALLGRLAEPLVRKNGELVPAGWGEALAAAAAGLAAARRDGGPGSIAVLGGARSTNEGAYAWTKLAKGILGTDSVDAQLGDGLPAELVLSLPRATIDEACAAPTVVLLCGDLREEIPVLYLRLRLAALGKTSLVELSPRPTSLTPYSDVSLRARPGDLPALVGALVDGQAIPPHPEGDAASAEDIAKARDLLGTAGPAHDAAGSAGQGIVIVLGRPSMAEHQDVVATAARRLAAALPGARFLPALRRGNVMGALDMGMAPGLLPGRVSLDAGRQWFAAAWGSAPETRGLDATAVLSALAAKTGAVRALVLLGADVLGDASDRDLAARALDEAPFVVAVTGHVSETVTHADVVLPAAVEHERPGTTTNIEGRVSSLGQKLVAPGLAWPDWMIATELAAELGGDLGISSASDAWNEIARLVPAFAGMADVLDAPGSHDGVVAPADGAAPRGVSPIDPMATPGVESVERQGAPPRVGGAERLVPAASESFVPGTDGMPGLPGLPGTGLPPAVGASRPVIGAGLGEAVGALTEPHVAPPDSYSLRLVSPRSLYDGGVTVAHSPSLVPLIPEAAARANPYDLDRLGITTGDSVTVRTAKGSLTLLAEADEGIPRGVVSIGFNLPAGATTPNAVAVLIDATAPVTEVRLESVR